MKRTDLASIMAIACRPAFTFTSTVPIQCIGNIPYTQEYYGRLTKRVG